VATAEFEYILLGTWSDDVNDPAVVFLLAQALKHKVISNGFLVLNEVVSAAAGLEHQWISIFADLTFEGLPEESREVLTSFGLTLNFEPAAETFQVDETY